MGFCLYNNVAVAAAHALAMGLTRVVVMDYDVHHGNGTQWIFYDDGSAFRRATVDAFDDRLDERARRHDHSGPAASRGQCPRDPL